MTGTGGPAQELMKNTAVARSAEPQSGRRILHVHEFFASAQIGIARVIDDGAKQLKILAARF
jgi:hypothetical protein